MFARLAVFICEIPMAKNKIWTNWSIIVFLALLSRVTLTSASVISGCNSTGMEINLDNMTLSGNLTSPNYPSWTPGNSSCIWLLNCPQGRLIKLSVHELMFNNSSENNSYLEIHDGLRASSPLIINLTAGEVNLNIINYSVPIIYSTGRKMSLHLKKGSKGATGSLRFFISYSSTKPGKTCSANNSDDENKNIILNPPFLLTLGKDLPTNVDCTWKIKPSTMGSQIYLSFSRQNDLFCSTGNAYIFDSPFGFTGKLKQNVCQDQDGMSSFSSETGLSFQLKSYNFTSVFQLKATEESCIVGVGSYWTKQPKTGKAFTKVQCSRKFSTDDDSPLLFSILFIDLPNHCRNNSIEIFELQRQSNKSRLRAKFCGRIFSVPDIVIYSGHALIKIQIEDVKKRDSFFFSTTFNSTGPRNLVTKRSYCSQYNTPEENTNITLTDRTEYLFTPNYIYGFSFPHPPGLVCKWIIVPVNVTEKEQIEITFVRFKFSKGYDKDCNQDNVKLDFSDGQVQRYCRATGGPPVIYSGEAKTVNITFTATPLFTGNGGFMARYKIVPFVKTSPSRRLSWTVIGVLIAACTLLVACVAFCIYRCKKKRKIQRERQQMTNERDEQENPLHEEEAVLPIATPTPLGPPPPYVGKSDDDSPLLQHPTEEQPHPWFSPGTTIMKHSPRERRPEPEIESKV